MPSELIDEIEMTNNRDNGVILVDYMNEVLFKDYRVICSTGMREYFIMTASEREKSY